MLDYFRNTRTTTDKKNKLSKASAFTNQPIFSFLLCSTILTSLLWLPFGIRLNGLIEEWGLLGVFTNHGVFFAATPGSLLSGHAARPLTLLPQAIAYFLDSDSFVYWNLMLYLSLILKGTAASYIVWRITNSFRWALFMGPFMLVYPADSMQLSFRALHINWALALSLSGCCLLFKALDAKRRSTETFHSAVSALIFLMALAMYEASFAYIIFPFALIIGQKGIVAGFQIFWRKKNVVLIWLLAPLAYLVYATYVVSHGNTYQQSFSANQDLLIANFPKLFSIGLLRSVLGGWVDATLICFRELSWTAYIYLFIACSLIFAFLYGSQTTLRQVNHEHCSGGTLIRMSVICLFLIICGYSPYIFSLSHLYISQRTFLFATPAAAMFWIFLLLLLSKASSRLANGFSFIMLFIGLGAGLFQFHHYVQLSTVQTHILADIVDHFDGKMEKDNTLLIRDKSNLLDQIWMFYSTNLQGALAYMYGHPFENLQICSEPGHYWLLIDTVNRPGQCIEKEQSWVFSYPEPVRYNGKVVGSKPPVLVIPKERITAITIDASAATRPAAGSVNYDTKNNPHFIKKYNKILAEQRWPQYFNSFFNTTPPDRYKWGFGDWWNLDLPTAGIGWRGAEWTVGNFKHSSGAWKTQENSALRFQLEPSKHRYRLAGLVDSIISDEIRSSIMLVINKHAIKPEWIDTNEFIADLPSDYLKNGSNLLVISSKVDMDYFGLSFRLLNIELAPMDDRQKEQL
ncbi:hypothetical protein Lbir_2271 [Legionella birminghamensis]|uniref:Transmembrane protein n=1 Tax=Legionella birminghamensis TaxID=28083 RepID=A0A378I6A7_9GAMM|nr:hypothetical protein [Legionella birminghamensis]KTC68738.1 hypothetical protein Lbir_2271 [Legionella birminghamensis]STX30276.1 Uncharacterised protein [Legionella birminghamensis]